MKPIVQSIKEKNDNLDFIKIKLVRRMKTQTIN